MDLLTFLGIIAAIVTIAIGIGTAVYFVAREDSQVAKRVLAITGGVLVVVVILGILMSQTRGTSGGSQLGNGDSRTSTPTNTPTDTPTPTMTPTLMPTATSVPPGTVLYQETGSDNWSGWAGGDEWKVSNGVLINDGSQSSSNRVLPSIVAPFQPSTSNYSVEVQARLPNGICGGVVGWFGISARIGAVSGSASGYAAYVSCGSVIGINSADRFLTSDCCYDPGTGWHTYRFELKGATLNYYIDGLLSVSTEDAKFLFTKGQVGLRADHRLLYVRRVVVTAL